MKKTIALLLSGMMLFSLCACGKSEAAQAVDDMTKSEMINVFLALLELLKLQTLRIEQAGQFNQIAIISNEVEE